MCASSSRTWPTCWGWRGYEADTPTRPVGGAARSAQGGPVSVGWAGLLDGVIMLALLEMAALLAWHRRTGRGLAPRALLPNLLAGLCLMLALRGALVGAHAAWLPGLLAAAGLAHVADLRQRWAGLPSPPAAPR